MLSDGLQLTPKWTLEEDLELELRIPFELVDLSVIVCLNEIPEVAPGKVNA